MFKVNNKDTRTMLFGYAINYWNDRRNYFEK